VRERSAIDEIVGEHLQLRRAGGGSLKGLCPFHDEKSPSFQVTPARGLFYCLAGETRVLTWDGVRSIRDLAGGTHRILGRNANWMSAPFYSFGVQPLMKISMGRNGQHKVIHATAEHRWFVTSGRGRGSDREVLTDALRPGHRLRSTYPRRQISRTPPSPFGIAHGFTFGDGARLNRGSVANFDPVKDVELLKYFPNSYIGSYGSQLRALHLPGYFKDLPSLDESGSYLYGWLAGYFAADGCVAKDGTLILNSASRQNLEFARDVCTRLGIGTYGVTEQIRAGFPGREPSSLYRIHLVNGDLTEDFFLLSQHRLCFSGASKAFAPRGWVIESVEPTERVEEVFCAIVDEGHAFALEDNILTGNCFGCGAGGDVIRFVEQVEHLSFTESVERLATRAGIQLRYEDTGSGPGRSSAPAGQRGRLLEANKLAAAFYAEQLAGEEALQAREFLAERGFDRDVAEQFNCGFAPGTWDALTRHLRTKGFTESELTTAGLARQSSRGTLIDRFHRRLLWPIKDITGDVIGFGARKIFDDDDGPKYLNTPDTPLYKKSHVLYGIERAKGDIAKRHQAVVVEGYTDVMACHLAGIPTAIASCGTAFGIEHIGVLRRLLMDQDELRGEVIYTFDGDAAGQAAALKMFGEDQRFVAQTFVAIEPEGRDPCELRQDRGDEAVRDLIARRVPLVAFVLRATVARYDLETAEGRVTALQRTAPMVAHIKDRGLRPEYARVLAGLLGMDMDSVITEVRRAGKQSQGTNPSATGRGGSADRSDRGRPSPNGGGPSAGSPGDSADETGPAAATGTARPRVTRPDDGTASMVEREALKAALQRPAVAGPVFDAVGPAAYTQEAYRLLRIAVAGSGGAGAAPASGPAWAEAVSAGLDDPILISLVTQLCVEPLRAGATDEADYIAAVLARLQHLAAVREVTTLKGRLQRMNPEETGAAYWKLYGELIALEQQSILLGERGMGGQP